MWNRRHGIAVSPAMKRARVHTCLAGSAAIAAACAAHGETFGLAPPSERTESGWLGYLNARFGLRIDLPASGFRQQLSPDGSGITLTSLDRAVIIAVHANWLQSILPGATDRAGRSIASLHGQAIAETEQKGGDVTYSVQRDDFYVISGTIGSSVYYERVAISPACPDVFDAVRLTYPQALERALDPLVTRVSLSLRAVCPSRVE